MNFNSFVPLIYRLSVVKCLLNRAIRLCSSWNLLHLEISCIKSMLMRNSFPSWILDRIIKQSVSNYMNPVAKFGPHKERLYVGLRFLGKSTDGLRRSIKTICKKFIPNKDVIIYYKAGCRVSHCFNIKDTTPFEMRSGVVYEYKCVACHCNYIGQSSRHLRHRIAEHQGVSHLTGRVRRSQFHSSIRDHCFSCKGATYSTSNFKVLTTGRSEHELLIKERLLIDQLTPALNGNVGSRTLLLY